MDMYSEVLSENMYINNVILIVEVKLILQMSIC